MKKYTKATSKGQITLPAKWRKKFPTNYFMMAEVGGKIEIQPVMDEEVIFNAERDNEGEGVPLNDFISLLEDSLQNDR